MNTLLSSKPKYTRDIYLGTIQDLFGPRGILSKYIVGFDLNAQKLSITEPKNGRVTIGLSELHSLSIPETGIQKDAMYDCFISSEKNASIRFRIDKNGKSTILHASRHVIRPNQINIVESKGESYEEYRSLRSKLINRVKEIFSPKK